MERKGHRQTFGESGNRETDIQNGERETESERATQTQKETHRQTNRGGGDATGRRGRGRGRQGREVLADNRTGVRLRFITGSIEQK